MAVAMAGAGRWINHFWHYKRYNNSCLDISPQFNLQSSDQPTMATSNIVLREPERLELALIDKFLNNAPETFNGPIPEGEEDTLEFGEISDSYFNNISAIENRELMSNHPSLPSHPRTSTPRILQGNSNNKENCTPKDIRHPPQTEAPYTRKKSRRTSSRKPVELVKKLFNNSTVSDCRFDHSRHSRSNHHVLALHAMAVTATDNSAAYNFIRGKNRVIPLTNIMYTTIKVPNSNYTMCVRWENRSGSVWLNNPNPSRPNTVLKAEELNKVLLMCYENNTLSQFNVCDGKLRLNRSSDLFTINASQNEFSIHSDRYEDVNHSLLLCKEILRILKTSYEVRSECYAFYHEMASHCSCSDLNILRSHLLAYYYARSLIHSENVYPILPFYTVISELVGGYSIL